MTINITHKERVEFLKSYNDLKTMLQTIHECNDIWMSDVGKLESMEYLIRKVMKFTAEIDEQGNRMYYADYVLEEIDDA